MASVSDMGCAPRIIFLVGGYGKRDAARHCSAEQTNKAQNDRRLVPNVGLVWRPYTPGTTKFCMVTEGVHRPSLGERVELKVGWPTVKVPFVMVWGLSSAPFSLFLKSKGGLKLSMLC